MVTIHICYIVQHVMSHILRYIIWFEVWLGVTHMDHVIDTDGELGEEGFGLKGGWEGR